MTKPSRVIVLTEDQRQQRFVREFLREAGYQNGNLRFEPLPGNTQGGGEQWVRSRYRRNVRAYRARTRGKKAATALVAVIDADKASIADRNKQLDDSLAPDSPRAASDVIIHLVPRRNIETWLRSLNQDPVNEEDDYKKPGMDHLIQPAAEAFFRGSRRGTQPPAHWVWSLKNAVPEVRRLP